MITKSKKLQISKLTIGIIVGIVAVAVILVLVFSLSGTKKEVAKCDLALGACADASGKIISGVTSQGDCEGVVDSVGIRGVWNEGQKCYQIGTNNALAPLSFGKSFTIDMCKNNPKTYRYFETGVCLVNFKPIETADTKVKCEGQGTWDANLDPCTTD